MQYAELAEFSCWLAVIGSQHKGQLNLIICISFSLMTLSVRGTIIVNRKNRLQEQRSDLLRNVHILLNISGKSLENAKYVHEKFRRVFKRKAETQRQLQLMYYRSSIIVNALNNLFCRKLYNNEIAQLLPRAFSNLPKLTDL